MGILLSVLGRGEPMIDQRNANDQVVAQRDLASEASSLDSDSENDLFEAMGLGMDEQGRRFFTVNGVPCFTRSQLELELGKRRRVDGDNGLVDDEDMPAQPLPEEMSIPELETEIENYQEGYKRLRKLVNKLEETKVELIQMKRKQATLEDLGNVQNNRPVVVRNMHSCPYFKKAKTIRGQLISKKIGEQLVKYQKAENDKHLDDGACYTFLVTVQPTAAATNCGIELVGHEDPTTVAKVPQNKVPGSARKRAITLA